MAVKSWSTAYCGQLWVWHIVCGQTCDGLYHFTQKSTTPILALKLSVSATITPGGLPHSNSDQQHWVVSLVGVEDSFIGPGISFAAPWSWICLGHSMLFYWEYAKWSQILSIGIEHCPAGIGYGNFFINGISSILDIKMIMLSWFGMSHCFITCKHSIRKWATQHNSNTVKVH